MNDLDSDYESYPAHTRLPDDEILAIYAELTVNGEYDLLPYEQEWKIRGPLLFRNGYQLRQRYNLDWQPSWEDTNLNPFFCEDSIDTSTPNVMDALRVSDGLQVAIKATLSWTTEAPIAFLFTDGNAVEEPRNHCVPILDTFIDETEDIVYIVMPLLRAFNDPAFVTVAEVIDFVDQMVQGIEYMHEQNVAHRDITVGNIMMDASELFPEGFHPVRQNLSRNGLTEVVGIMRTHAPVRYYLIDFDAAIAFERGTPIQHKFAEGKAGRDDEVPEFKDPVRYDPFKVDIFQFGNLLKKEVLQKYSGVEFLGPLVKEMTRNRPSDRPNAKDLRVKFNTIRNRLTAHQIRAHLEAKNTSDPLREHLAALGIESILESESDDSPEQSSSEAPTTARSSHSNESYWSRSMESSITSPSSPEQQSNPNSGAGAFQKISNVFTRPRSPARTSSSGGTTIWRPAKKARSPSPPPRSAPQAIPQPESHSGSNSGNASPRSRSRLRTGKFPWSRSSSPDSASTSPILAVVNHFLSPERMYNNTEDAFENTYQPPVEERMGWSRPTAAPTPTTAVPPKVNPPVPTPAPAPAPTTTRNRRNTVNAAPAPPPPAPVPAPTPVVPVQTAPKPAAAAAAAKSRINGWDGMDSMHNAPVAPSPQDYFSFGNQYPQQQMYNKPNKSANALSMFPSQPQTWEPTNYGDDYGNDYGHGMDEQYDMPAEDMYDEPPMWSAEALRALSSPSPAPAPKPATVKPVEKKEPVVVEKKETIAEKRARLAKSPTSTLSKKSSPAEAVASTTVSSAASTLRVGTVASRLAAAAAAANRKSTIAVEDATPSNTPPKPTVSLPAASVSPPKTSPVANKIKRTKTKKNSISEAPKEKEAAPVVNEEPWSMPAIRDEFGTVKTRKRGNSGASTTSRPSSPLAFLGGRSRSGSKVEPPPKPTNTKPAAAAATSFISSAFGWGAKPKASPAAAEPEPENGGFFGFSGFGWKNQPEEPPRPTAQRNMMSNRPESEHPNIFTQRNMVSNRPEPEVFAGDYDVSSSPVSTPPQKGAWKPKTSYFEPHTKPVASSPQEEEDFSNLMASMRMSMAAGNAEAPKSAFNFHDRVEDATAFQFAMPGLNNKGGDDFWSAAMDAFGVDPSPSPEEKKQLPEPVEMSRSPPRARGIKNKFEPVEPVDPKPTPIKGAKKKMMPIKAKTFTVESPTPTPTTEAEDPWNMVEPPRAERAPKPVEVPKPAFTGWFSEAADAAEEEEGTPQVVAAAELEPASPEPDSWFNVKPKAKLGARVTKAATAEPVPAPTPAFAMTTKGAKGKKLTKVEKVEEIPEPEPVVEEAMPEPPKEDDEWPEFKPKAKKGKKAKEPEPATAAPVANKWSSFGMDNEEDELAATLAADLEEQGQTQAQAQDEADKQAEEEAAAKEAEKEAAKSNAKAPQPKTAKGGKKKGKR